MVTRRQPEAEDEITGPSDLGFVKPKEIEVDPIQPLPVEQDDHGFVVVRMAQTIEQFTYGDPHRMYHLKEGNRYRVPVHIAQYLDDLGYLYH